MSPGTSSLPRRTPLETREVLERKIRSANKLHSVVKTMKLLSAVNVRHYDRAVRSLTRYARTVELGFQVLLRSGLAERAVAGERGRRRLGAIVVGSDQGLCGPLNELIVEHARAAMEGSGVPAEDRLILVIGERAERALQASRAGLVEDVAALPGAASGITSIVQDILVRVERWIFSEDVDRVLFLYSKRGMRTSYEPHGRVLLPLDRRWLDALARAPWPSRRRPTHTMERGRLFSALLRQHLFVTLYQGLAESLASENASRLASMERADKNVGELIERLQADLRQRSQMAITEELLDITSGFEALSAEP